MAGLSDQTLIERIKYIKENATQKDWWNDLSRSEQNAIDKGITDADNGNVTSHGEVKKRYGK